MGLVLTSVLTASAQTDWRPIGSSAMESRLAGPVSGPMVNVWYAADGSKLYASTGAKIFETEDFENWKLAVDPPDPPKPVGRQPVRSPEPGATYLAVSAGAPDVWGLGRQLYHSEDGVTWQTLTSYRSGSVIGGGMKGFAVSPRDANQLAVANEAGVWRSMDGGLTWASLNLHLPNLPVERIVATPSGGHAARILDNDTVLELPPGNALWQLAAVQPRADAAIKTSYSSRLGTEISAFAASTDARQVYVGSKDGRFWESVDGGITFHYTQSPAAAAGRMVERLYVNPARPSMALAVLAGKGAPVLRTWDGGNRWEALGTDGLPDVPVNSVTADPASGSVYLATDQGVYWTQFSFEYNVPTNDLHWKSLSEGLPPAKAVDVALDPAGVQVYAALEGYGLFGSPAPHRGLRLVNAADFSSRAASPGSLVSILGEKINSVTAGSLRYPLWSNSQIQVPFEAVGPTVSLALETASGTTTRDLQVLPVSPAIFVGTDGAPMILDADSGLPLEGNVAHPGQRLQVLVTGMGRVHPDWFTGQPAPLENPPAVVAKVQAYLDRSEVPVTRATLAPGYVGYYLVEVQLPPIANYGGMELYVSADGQDSNHVQILISQ